MKNIFKTIGYYLSVPFVFFVLFISLLFVAHKTKKYLQDPNSIFLQDRYKKIYKLFSKFLYLKRVDVITEDIEKIPAKQMLFIANHKSNLDPMVMFKALYDAGKLGQISFVCKNELSKHWYTRCVIQLMDGIFIQRDDGRSILECYNKEMKNIKNGFSIAVYPEGTRVPGDNFKEFNSTTLKVAFQNFISIQPIAIYGADKKRKTFYKLNVYVSAIKTVQPNNYINTKQENLMKTIQNNVTNKYIKLKIKAQGGYK